MDQPLKTLHVALGEGHSIAMSYRDGTRDRFTLEENWRQHPYRLERHRGVARRHFADQEYQRITAAGLTPLIIDAGANIGASVLFFRWRYPLARVIAIEPERSNFGVLQTNVGKDPLVICEEAALASFDGELELRDPGRSTDAFRAVPKDNAEQHGASLGSVPAVSIGGLLAQQPENVVPFFCKIDIEGGEKELFAANTDWVDRFPVIAIELHDWLLPRAGSSAPFLACVGSKGRDFINPAGTDIVFSLLN